MYVYISIYIERETHTNEQQELTLNRADHGPASRWRYFSVICALLVAEPPRLRSAADYCASPDRARHVPATTPSSGCARRCTAAPISDSCNGRCPDEDRTSGDRRAGERRSASRGPIGSHPWYACSVTWIRVAFYYNVQSSV